MNKPAPKEPSMDEILSSIRQIIADDDAAVAPRKPAATPSPAAQAEPPAPRPPIPTAAAPRPVPQPAPAPAEPETLTLTPDQMVGAAAGRDERLSLDMDDVVDGIGSHATAEAAMPADGPELVDPEDIAFDMDVEADDEVAGAVAAAEPPPPQPAPVAPPRPATSVARASPMPDPQLSSDMADQILAPTTDAAVKHAFTRLNGLSMVGSGKTIDGLVRELLRPMLKDWLDEHLPSVVERMVEKEIARVSRGGE